ncbi:MAG: class II glutamine amidotransferase, partial [Planctomycetota bacterium]|nr:class II glutamine amidotransferase [Planctomycetota bacterium]
LLLRPKNSLVNQSLDAKEFRLRVNCDGFGVAWYAADRGEPVRFRTVTPAWNNQNLRSIAPATESRCVLAHVRAASPGLPVVETNCHPFCHNDLVFCHNGLVGGFGRARRALLRGLTDHAFADIEGTTDSELVFAYVLDEHRARGSGATGADLAAALEAAIRRVVEIAGDEPSYLNLCVTNGTAIAASRFSTDPDGQTSSLYVHRGRRYTCEDDEVCRMVDGGADEPTAIVASERLSDDPGWEAFPVDHVAAIEADGSMEFRAF